MLKVDAETEERLREVAEARGQSPDLAVREAMDQFLEREEKRRNEQGRHPSGKAWPRRHVVGGIITPV